MDDVTLNALDAMCSMLSRRALTGIKMHSAVTWKGRCAAGIPAGSSPVFAKQKRRGASQSSVVLNVSRFSEWDRIRDRATR